MGNQLTHSQRFVEKMKGEYSASIGADTLTDNQVSLAQSYFIALDSALKTSEVNRLKKSEKYRDDLPVTWENVNYTKLSREVVHFAKLGLNPLINNHLFFIPFKNKSTGEYDITFMEGYKGEEIIAKKYGLDVPKDLVVELIYSTDEFSVIKKDHKNEVEGYCLDITNPFDRGEIIGGFWYKVYEDERQNKIKLFSLKDILKRKPKYGGTEFWGGEKDKWENGKATGKKIQIEGWKEEMYTKTILRNAWGSIIIDNSKINEDYTVVKKALKEPEYVAVAEEPKEKKETKIIGFDEAPEETKEPKEEPKIQSEQPQTEELTMEF